MGPTNCAPNSHWAEVGDTKMADFNFTSKVLYVGYNFQGRMWDLNTDLPTVQCTKRCISKPSTYLTCHDSLHL